MSLLRRRALLVGVVVLALHGILVTALAPVILIPGFMSSRLLAWKHKSCDTFDINVGDRVWLDVTHVVYDSFREDCWVSCMMFEDILEQEDTDCRLRAVSSIEAISELEPGQITGYLSAIFRDIIKLLAQEFGYDPSNIQAAPYDWRLPPSMLQKRDNYFTNLRHTLEDMVGRNAEPAIIIAHSMGNNVFLYFVEWMKLQPDLQDEDAYQQWFDEHVNAWVNVAGPLLGAPGTLRSVLSGFTFGLPISEIAMKRMGSTFGSFGMLLPLSDNGTSTLARPSSGWSLNGITVDYRDRGKPVKSYTSSDHHDLFKDMATEYSDMTHLLPILKRYYDSDPLAAALMHPPKRPPLRNVYCIYGINEPTEIGYHYKATEDGPVLKKWLWEGDGGELYSTSFTAIKSQSLGFSEFLKSGDGSVPYTSLSWCNAWHLGEPEITHTQTTFEDGNTRLPLFRRMIGTQTQVFGQGRYESVRDGRRTIVVELEKINHRHVIRSQKLLEILVDELPKLRRYYNETAVSEDERNRVEQQQHEKEREQQQLQQLQQLHLHHATRVPTTDKDEAAESTPADSSKMMAGEAEPESNEALIDKYTRLTRRLESLLQTAQSRLVELRAKSTTPGSAVPPASDAETAAASATELDLHDCTSMLDEHHQLDSHSECVHHPTAEVPELRGPFSAGQGEAELHDIADRDDEQFDDPLLE